MRIAIIGMGTAKGKDLASLKAKPEFRKATVNMTSASASQDEALSPFSGELTSENLNSSVLILGSSHGELETTVSFLDYLSQSGVARPLLFQNSLHNSTLGFLTMRLHLTGPALTVSNRFYTGEDCLDLALTLLHERERPFCVVTAVDSRVPQLDIDSLAGPRGEGAATLILTRQETAEKKGWAPLAYLDRIDYSKVLKKADLTGPAGSHPAYDSDALERLIEHLRSDTLATDLTLHKPDGSQTVIRLERS